MLELQKVDLVSFYFLSHFYFIFDLFSRKPTHVNLFTKFSTSLPIGCMFPFMHCFSIVHSYLFSLGLHMQIYLPNFLLLFHSSSYWLHVFGCHCFKDVKLTLKPEGTLRTTQPLFCYHLFLFSFEELLTRKKQKGGDMKPKSATIVN